MSRPGPHPCSHASPRAVRVALAVLACVSLTFLPGWSDAAHADPVDTEAVIAARLAEARASAGLPALARSSDLDAVARDWARRQAADGAMGHNPQLRDQVQPARSWYENVGSLTGVPERRSYRAAGERLHEMWMDSSGHRANILRTPLTDVGIGVATARGELYATVVFREQDGAPAAEPARAPAASPEPSPAPSPAPSSRPEPQATANSTVPPTPAASPEPPAAEPDPEPQPEPAPEPSVDPTPEPEPTGPPAHVTAELERPMSPTARPVRLAAPPSQPPAPERSPVPAPERAAVEAAAVPLPVRDGGLPTLPVVVGLATIAGAAAVGASDRRRTGR